MGTYQPAAVCRRGHPITADIARHGQISPKCAKCGAVVLSACEDCGKRIRGDYQVPGVAVFGSGYDPPDFCDQCGGPHPWASRQARLWQLENLLDEEDDLSAADRLTLHEQLEELRSGELSEEDQAERWKTIKRIAPEVLETGKKIAESIMTAAIKSQLGL